MNATSELPCADAAGPQLSWFRRLVAWDEAVLCRVQRWQRPALTKLLRAVTHLGDGTSLTFLGLVMFAIGEGHTRQLGVLLALSTSLAAGLSQVLKRRLRRARPSHGIAGFQALVGNPDAFSFPSGHTAATVALAIAWAHQGSWLGALAFGLASLVGFSRVYLGAHYPLDVMAGALLGLASGALALVLAS
jgi:undecaprenyl-diphosphatase